MLKTTKNTLSKETREKVVTLLLSYVANATDMYLQAKVAHWNVRGPRFLALHEMFDKVAEGLQAPIDEIAERIGQLGGIVSTTTVQNLVKSSSLNEISVSQSTETYMLNHISESLTQLGEQLRQGIDATAELGDAGSSDMLTSFSREIDQLLWFVESHLVKD